MNKEQFAKLFPIGSHLCREPMPPMRELKKDMENLKRHGFNMVKLQESWLTDEPEEGKYDFSVSQELIEHAAKLDMGVYFGLSMEHAPGWLWNRYPGARMIGRDGVPLMYEAQLTIPADGKPGPCFDDPDTREAQLRFIRKLVTTLGSCENIVVWNTWQEMGYEGERLAGQKICYCPNTIRAFQEWLRARHGGLEELNRCWKSRYTRWEDVVPNRGKGGFCLPNNIAYEYFLDNIRITDILGRRAQAIKESDPLHRPVFAHQGSSTVGSGIDWSFAKAQDFLGCSCYPAWFHLHSWDDAARLRDKEQFRHQALLNEMWESVALKFDYLRGCNAQGSPLWGAEFQGGPISTGLYKGRVPSAEDIRRWMLTAVASGANALSFWVTRAEIQGHEINGYSLLDSAGDTTPRYEEAGRVARALGNHAALFAPGNVPRAQAAILVNEGNYKLCAEVKGGAEEHLMYSTRGWHRMFWEQGVPVDFIEARELDQDFVRQYRMLVLPMPLSLSEQVAQRLAAYVEQGGLLVCEACPGRFDPFGFGNRGELSPAMAKLFGVEQAALTMVEEPGEGDRWRMHQLSWGDYADSTPMTGSGLLEGIALTPNLYLTTFRCTDATPIMTSKQGDCATIRQMGRGRAMLLGTFVGHSGTAYRDGCAPALVRRLLEEAGATRPHRGSLLVRQLESPAGMVLMVTNPTDSPVTEELVVPEGCTRIQTLFDEPLQSSQGRVAATVLPLDVAVLLCTR